MKKASDLVLKIKRRRVKELIDETEETVWEYTAEIVGIIETRFEFTGTTVWVTSAVLVCFMMLILDW